MEFSTVFTRQFLINRYEQYGEEKDKRYLENCLKKIDALNSDKEKILELIDSQEALFENLLSCIDITDSEQQNYTDKQYIWTQLRCVDEWSKGGVK